MGKIGDIEVEWVGGGQDRRGQVAALRGELEAPAPRLVVEPVVAPKPVGDWRGDRPGYLRLRGDGGVVLAVVELPVPGIWSPPAWCTTADRVWKASDTVVDALVAAERAVGVQ